MVPANKLEISTDELKQQYGADTVLLNKASNMWHVCHKIINAEFEMIDENTEPNTPELNESAEVTENSGSN